MPGMLEFAGEIARRLCINGTFDTRYSRFMLLTRSRTHIV